MSAPFETEFVVMLQKKTFIGSRYTMLPANRAKFIEAWKTGCRRAATPTRTKTDAGSAATPRS